MSNDSTLGPQERRRLMSALADGDTADGSAASACALWSNDAQAREAWHAYHLIGDVLRSEDLAAARARDEAFLSALRGRLAAEPVVLAPAAIPALQPARRRSWLAPAAVAASVAAVAGVLVVTRMSAPGTGAAPVLALAPAASVPAADRPGEPQWQVVDGNLIRDARLDGYLRAHRGGPLAMPGGATGRFETVVLDR